jgi:uncharacterized membrane protein YfcA
MVLFNYYICAKFFKMFAQFLDYLQTADPFSAPMLAILIGVGFFVGFVNTLAGMATVLSYALFMAMGMPINIANGTTRFGVLAQFAVSSVIFKREGYLDLKEGYRVGIPVAIGSLVGAQLVAVMNPKIIEIVMGCILPFMAYLLISDKKPNFSSIGGVSSKITLSKFIIFTLIGVYGGFTHAGVGILIIFGSVYLLGTDMLRGNAIKQFAVVMYTPIALAVFIWHDQVNWPIALIYSIGNIAGAVLASKLAVKWGVKFIRWCVGAAVIFVAFWLIYKQF